MSNAFSCCDTHELYDTFGSDSWSSCCASGGDAVGCNSSFCVTYGHVDGEKSSDHDAVILNRGSKKMSPLSLSMPIIVVDYDVDELEHPPHLDHQGGHSVVCLIDSKQRLPIFSLASHIVVDVSSCTFMDRDKMGCRKRHAFNSR